jgi:hypothetical protein
MVETLLADSHHQLKEAVMYAITGITGQVGGAVARALLAARLPVSAVVRAAGKGATWAEHGCEVAIADMNDAVALTAAFTGAEGVFVLIPPIFDPAPGFPGGAGNRCGAQASPRRGAPGQGRVPVDDRRAGHAAKPPQPAWHHGAGAWPTAPADRFSQGRMVHGELRLRRRAGARDWRHPKLLAAARQAGADGCHGGYRTCGGGAPSGPLERPSNRRAGRAASHYAE